jgi:hypothetical protein
MDQVVGDVDSLERGLEALAAERIAADRLQRELAAQAPGVARERAQLVLARERARKRVSDRSAGPRDEDPHERHCRAAGCH